MNSMRDHYRELVESADYAIHNLEEEVAQLERDVARLGDELAESREREDAMRNRLHALKISILDAVQADNDAGEVEG